MKALILIDIQNDFLPGGALPVPDGHLVIPVANRVQPGFPLVVASQDWHPPDHRSFATRHPGKKPGDVIIINNLEQSLWPPHCVRDTPGAELAAALDVRRIARVFRKGADPEVDSYSAFFDVDRVHATGLAEFLRERMVTDVWVMGLATEYGVKYTALDAARLGFSATVVEDGCRGFERAPGDAARALKELRQQGVRFAKSDEVQY